MQHLIVDVASAGLADAERFLVLDDLAAPANYSDPVKIESYLRKKKAEAVARCGLDWDLSRITGLGLDDGLRPTQLLCKDEQDERAVLMVLAEFLREAVPPTLITYNGLSFDLPLLCQRARYLRIDFPELNTDRYRSPHRDLMQELSRHDPQRRKPLEFWRRRLGWLDLQKPLSGEDEALIFEHERWDDLRESLRVDVETVSRLACWLGILKPAAASA